MIESELNLRRSEVLAMQAKMESLEAERQDAEQQKFQLALEPAIPNDGNHRARAV